MVSEGMSYMEQSQNPTNVDLNVIRAAFEPNFFGLVQTCTTFLPLIRKSPNGVIVNVSSGVQHQTSPT